MPFRNCSIILALIVSYFIYGQNTVSIFILDSNNKVDSAWVANRYTQVGFTPLISISEINTSLNNSNFDVVIVAEGYSYVDTFNDYIGDFLIENEKQIVQNGIYTYKLLFKRKLITGTFIVIGKNKKGPIYQTFLRRERDSNPRYIAVQWFSRPPHSTTLPSLLRTAKVKYF